MGSDNRIPCDDSVFSNLRAEKDERGMTWNAYLKWLFKQAHKDVAQDCETQSVEIDADEIMDQLRDELSDLLTIELDVDLSDESELSEEDVKRIVRDHIERRVHERARNVR